ncbi:MAG: hypothetical protein K6A68_10680, partial [Clostridiales bacterium]|nr:hypothetical protein [Clostridiales bacterium]
MSIFYFTISNHLKMVQSRFYHFIFFSWTAGQGFRFIVVFPLDDPMFPFHLRDIQVRYMETVFLLHPILGPTHTGFANWQVVSVWLFTTLQAVYRSGPAPISGTGSLGTNPKPRDHTSCELHVFSKTL